MRSLFWNPSLLVCLVLCLGCGTTSPSSNEPDDSNTSDSGDSENDAPTLSTEFQTSEDLWDLQEKQAGDISFGNSETDAGSEDQQGALISLQGDDDTNSSHIVGPANGANQISTKEMLSFGIYRVRIQPASCESSEEVVNGIFVYSNDGESDTNGNGLIDNNEIDIEILCGEPNAIYLTTWTDYVDDDHFFKVTRKVDLETGEYWQTVPGEEGQYGLSDEAVGTIDEAALSNFSVTSDYYEMGFEWHAQEIRFFIVANDQEITLWEFTDATYIPQNPASFMLNIWYPGEHWYGGDASFPNADATMKVDWFKYWEE